MKASEATAERTSSVLRRLREAMDAALRPHGFAPAGPTRFADGRGLDQWFRDAGWKADGVDLVWRTPSPTSVDVAVYVRVPVGQGVELDGTTTSFLAGHGEYYDLPGGLFRGSREDKLVDTVVKDVVAALGWFEQYATPAKCLARLEEDDRNGPRKGSRLHQAAVEHLRSLA